MTLTPDLQASFTVTAYPLGIGTTWGEVWVRFEQRENRYARDKNMNIIKYTQNHHTSLYPKIVFTIGDNTVCPFFSRKSIFPIFRDQIEFAKNKTCKNYVIYHVLVP